MNKKSDGGLWVRQSKGGVRYLSGVIEVNGEKINFAAFRNTYKTDGDKKPDYTIKVNLPEGRAASTQIEEDAPF